MYTRLSSIMFPILLIALIGALFWGYQENQDKNSVLIKAENQYQRAFHDLSFNIDRLHTELGNALAVDSKSRDYHRKELMNVWRLTSQAQNEINQLPLTLLPFNKTEEFLSNIANFSYRVGVRDFSKQPLSQEETKTLKVLYDRSKEINNDLRNVQSKVLAKNLRWMDVEVALASENKTMDNTIIDGFKSVDKKVSEYSEVNWGPSMPDLYQKRSYKALSGTNVTPEQIRKKAAKFLGMKPSPQIKVVENGRGTEYSSYSVYATRPQTNSRTEMDYTKKGGQLIWFMDQRRINQKNLTTDDAMEAAQEFLQQHNYESMVPVNLDEYQNVANIVFAGKQGDVIVYPEKLTVKVALDDGDVTGFQAQDYVFEHKNRTIPKPAMNMQQAKKSLNPNFKVRDNALALIKNELKQEVLCYEFVGSINGGTYRIYINANTGTEEQVENLDRSAA